MDPPFFLKSSVDLRSAETEAEHQSTADLIHHRMKIDPRYSACAGGRLNHLAHSHLLPFSQTAQRLRISHNEHKASRETARQFVRKHRLSAAFSSVEDLRRALDANELWLLEVAPADSVRVQITAGSRFSSLVAHGDAEGNVAPPLPRHDDIVLECVRQGAISEAWSMTWREYASHRYTVRSESLREVMRRGLEISAGNAEGALGAFERWTIEH
jgi:hypothetical protein